jgi:Rho guanine nucleotide exchange factor 17
MNRKFKNKNFHINFSFYTNFNLFFFNLNYSSGVKNMTAVFSKTEKRTQWEETFNEAKQKLNSLIERFQVPDFIASVPITKTRAGLQFSCAAQTLGAQKDVWVCNSDGYVGQVCVLSLNQPEPTVTSCNGVCNAKILCIASVPAGYSDPNSSINDETTRSSLISISNASTVSNKTSSAKSAQSSGSNHQLDLSSSDSEPETQVERSLSPLMVANSSQMHNIDENESQMWLGTEDGFIHVYNCTDNIRTKKNKIKIPHVSSVQSILYLENRIFVSLANGDVCVYVRENGSSWNIASPIILSIGSDANPFTKLLNVYGKLWCSVQGVIKILNVYTLKVSFIDLLS